MVKQDRYPNVGAKDDEGSRERTKGIRDASDHEAGRDDLGEYPDSDDGFPRQGSLGKEIKIGLAVIVVLLVVLGAVVAMKLRGSLNEPLASAKNDPDEKAADDQPSARKELASGGALASTKAVSATPSSGAGTVSTRPPLNAVADITQDNTSRGKSEGQVAPKRPPWESDSLYRPPSPPPPKPPSFDDWPGAPSAPRGLLDDRADTPVGKDNRAGSSAGDSAGSGPVNRLVGSASPGTVNGSARPADNAAINPLRPSGPSGRATADSLDDWLRSTESRPGQTGQTTPGQAGTTTPAAPAKGAAPGTARGTDLGPGLRPSAGDLYPPDRLDSASRFAPPRQGGLPETSTRLAAAERTPGKRAYYVVREGDTLYDIARNELGKAARWAEIYELNREVIGKEFDYLTPGKRLELPEAGPSNGNVTRRTAPYSR